MTAGRRHCRPLPGDGAQRPAISLDEQGGNAVGFIPTPTRLAPLAVLYDATADDPLPPTSRARS